MDAKTIKLAALDYIQLHEGLNDEQKIGLMHYVAENSVEDVMGMLLTGLPIVIDSPELKKDVRVAFESSMGLALHSMREYLHEDWVQELDAEKIAKVGAAVASKAGEYAHKAGEVAAAAGTKIAQAYQNFKPSEHFPVIKKLASKMAASKQDYHLDKSLQKLLKLDFKGAGEQLKAATHFNQYYQQSLQALDKGIPIATAAALVMLLILGRIAYNRFLNKYARKCIKLRGLEKDKCIKDAKVGAVKAQIAELMQNKRTCSATRNPEKCAKKLDATIGKLKTKIQKEEEKFLKKVRKKHK